MKKDKQFSLPDTQAADLWAALSDDWREAEEECEVPASFKAGWRAMVRSENARMTAPDMAAPPLQDDRTAKEENKVENENPAKKKPIIPLHVRRYLAAAAAVVVLIGGTLMTRERPEGTRSAGTARRGSGYEAPTGLMSNGSGLGYSMEAEAMPKMAADTVDVNRAAPAGASITQKLIRTVRLRITTPQFDDDMKLVSDTVFDAGGYVESSEVNTGTAGYRSASLVLRIPQNKLDEAVQRLRGVGRTESFSETSEDVTESYADTETRLETAKVKLKRLQELLSRAETTEDLLKIEDALANAQYEADSLTGWLNRMDKQVNYSTVTLSIKEETPKDTSENAETLGERMLSALKLAWENGVAFLGDMLVFLVTILPFAAGVAILIFVTKRLIKRRKKK